MTPTEDLLAVIAAPRSKLRDVACAYRRARGFGKLVDWPRVNGAIRARWRKSLDKIKRLAGGGSQLEWAWCAKMRSRRKHKRPARMGYERGEV